MRRRRTAALATALLLAGLALAGLGSVYALLRAEPEFYRRACLPPGVARTRLSHEASGNFFNAMNNLLLNRQVDWDVRFTADQINSYLDEDFIRSSTRDKVLPAGWSGPRVAIEQDRLRLAIRYGRGLFASIISLDVRAWLVASEPNVVALELIAFRAGTLPVSSQSLLEAIRDLAHEYNIEVTWYRHGGRPVAILRFQTDQARATLQLHRLNIADGQIEVAGRSPDAARPSDKPTDGMDQP